MSLGWGLSSSTQPLSQDGGPSSGTARGEYWGPNNAKLDSLEIARKQDRGESHQDQRLPSDPVPRTAAQKFCQREEAVHGEL